MKCPCKGCEKRKLGCHARCGDYQAFSEWRADENRRKNIEAINRSKSPNQMKGYWKLLRMGSVNK